MIKQGKIRVFEELISQVPTYSVTLQLELLLDMTRRPAQRLQSALHFVKVELIKGLEAQRRRGGGSQRRQGRRRGGSGY